MKRPEPSDLVALPTKLYEDREFSKRWPTLFSHLACERWDDGGARETHTMLIFLEAGVWKAMLKDRTLARVCWVSAESFMSLLDTLEKITAGGKADWKHDANAKSRKKGKA